MVAREDMVVWLFHAVVVTVFEERRLGGCCGCCGWEAGVVDASRLMGRGVM
jgi:hypothetical protein